MKGKGKGNATFPKPQAQEKTKLLGGTNVGLVLIISKMLCYHGVVPPFLKGKKKSFLKI